ncbi:MAG: hypothetical protein AAF417_18920 [Pseudomonadota bacterium]
MKVVLSLAFGLLVIAIPASALANPIRIEAEDMTLKTYRVENLPSASNGRVINLKGPGIVGTAETVFTGQGGDYDIFIAYHDESDGVAQMTISLSDGTVETLTLDELTGDGQPTANNLRIRQIAAARSVGTNSLLKIAALQGNWDHANVDYIEFVPTSAPQSTQGFAVVAPSGGNYTNPIEAIQNLSSGDRWCREDPVDDDPCVLTIEPGVYELTETLELPGGILIIGAGPESTKLVSQTDSGIAIVVQDQGNAFGTTLRDLSIDHTNSNSALTSVVTLESSTESTLDNVTISTAGPSEVIVLDARRAESQFEVYRTRIEADAGGNSTGVVGAFLTIESTSITVSGAAANIGISLRANDNDGGRLAVRGTTVLASDGTSSIGIAASSVESRIQIEDTQIRVNGGSTGNTGLSVGGPFTRNELNGVDITVQSDSGSAATGISYSGTGSTEGWLNDVTARATGGQNAVALRIDELDGPIEIVGTDLVADGDGTSRGLVLTDGDGPLRVRKTRTKGETSAISIGSTAPTSVFLSFTDIDGPFVVSSPGTPQISCAAVIDGDRVFYPNSCPPSN